MPDTSGMISPSVVSDAPPEVLASRGVNDTPFVDDGAMLPASHQVDPARVSGIDPGPAYTPYEEPHHEGLFRRILGSVASAMGGDTTWKVTEKPDGTVIKEPIPSTEKEKWGRIAATMLGGLAKGLPQSFGPAGAANAASAGIQTGLQAPQKWSQDADAQATEDQQRVMRNGQNAAIQQNLYRGMLQNQQLEGVINEGDAKLLSEYNDAILATPNARDFGVVGGYDDLKRVYSTNPDFFKSHTNLQLKVTPIRDSKGKFVLHAVATDPGWDGQRVGKGAYRLFTDVDPETGEPTLKREDVAEGSQKNGTLALANQAIVEQYVKMHNAFTDTQTRKQAAADRKLDAEQRSKDRQDAIDQRRDDAAANRDLRRDLAISRNAGSEGGAPAASAANTRAGGGTVDQALGSIATGDRATVKAIGEGRMAPYSRASKEGQRIMSLVNSVYPDYDASRFGTYQAARTAFTSGKEGIGLNFIRTARNHLARMEQNIPDNVTIPFGVGSIINYAKNKANQSTSPQLKAFADDMEAVESEVASAYKNGALNVDDHRRMEKLLSSSDSPEAIRGAIQEFRELLRGKLQSYRDQWNSSMPQGVVSPLSTLENLEQERPTNRQQPPPTNNGGNQPPQLPAGAVAGRDKSGNIVGYMLNGKWVNL